TGWEGDIYWSPTSHDLLNISTGKINLEVLRGFLKVLSLSSMNQHEAQLIERIVGQRLQTITPRGIVTDGANDVIYWEEGRIKQVNPLSTQMLETDVEQIWRAPYIKNTTGCGDSFFGTARYVWEKTGNLDAAVCAGSYAASMILGSKNSNLMSVPTGNYHLIQQYIQEVLL
ncbi:MAG: hypothetical protein O3B87_05370, partial [bacterium]|nr:hypothetical protein [bacterium]